MERSLASQTVAALAAFTCWLGLGLYLWAGARSMDGDWLAALWFSLSFLTDLSNLILAVVMTGAALGHRWLSRTAVVGWSITNILMMGIAYWLFGGRLSTTSAPEDWLLHGATPLLALVAWWVFARGECLGWRLALVWVLWPVGYFGYALTRGWLSGTYPYPFLDPREVGTTGVAATAAIAIGVYVVCAFAVIAFNRWRSRPV